MNLKRENVLEVLGNITEPDLKKDIVSANLIELLEIGDNEISLNVLISNPALHARKRMQEAIEFNLRRFFGDTIEINCTIKGIPAESKQARRKVLPDVKNIIAI